MAYAEAGWLPRALQGIRPVLGAVFLQASQAGGVSAGPWSTAPSPYLPEPVRSPCSAPNPALEREDRQWALGAHAPVCACLRHNPLFILKAKKPKNPPKKNQTNTSETQLGLSTWELEQEDRQWALVRGLEHINREIEGAASDGVPCWFPMGTRDERILRLPAKEAILLNSRFGGCLRNVLVLI